jgi:RHS repeat-associated protein
VKWASPGGSGQDDVVYTAFGERIDGANHRYGYAGAWGYQAHSFAEVDPPVDPDDACPYLHVSWRYYDPSTGRFLQRDPTGIGGGGLNVYESAAGASEGRGPGLWQGSRNPLGPRGSLFGRGRLRGGRLGIFNRGNTRFGWSWYRGRNYFSIHGGRPHTSGHWHIYPNRPFMRPHGPVPRWARWGVRGLQGGLACAAAVAGYGTARLIDKGVKRKTGKGLSQRIGEWMYSVAPWAFDWGL